jgi:hypothetical protein
MADLTTLPNVRAWLNVSGNTDDALLSRLITSVSAATISYLSRGILTAIYTQTFNGNGRDRWTFSQYPVTAVSSVSVNGSTISAASSSTASGFVFDETTLYLRGGYRFCQGVQNVTVVYTAGYAIVPTDVEQACIDWISLLYKSKSRIGEQSKVIAGEQINYVVGPMPKTCELNLQQYRNVAPR